MPGTSGNKVKLLHLIDIFRHQTDEDHPMDAEDLIDALSRFGITPERKSVYRDVETLRDYGLDIIHTHQPKSGYFLGSRDLQLAEIRLLIDAVLSAGFITPKKSVELVEKLKGLCSRHQAAELDRQIYIERRKKQKNEEIYYTIDTINHAVERGKKITLEYGRRVLDAAGRVRFSKRVFTVSPYAMLWFDDRYYLICNHEKYNDLMHLRLDRMRRVKLLSEPSRSFEEVCDYRGFFDVADYAGRLSNAFGGTPMMIELLCRDDMLEPVLDRFGDDVTVRRHRPGAFLLRTKVAVSDGLVHDILNFGAGVEVKSPAGLRRRVAETVSELAAAYGEKAR